MGFQCKYCKSHGFFLRYSTYGTGGQVGMYCSACHKWVKWIGKSEMKLLKDKGHPVLQAGAMPVVSGNENTVPSTAADIELKRNKPTVIIACERCGSTDIRVEKQGVHVGAYCNHCNNWIKWLSRSEILAVSSKSVVKDSGSKADKTSIKHSGILSLSNGSPVLLNMQGNVVDALPIATGRLYLACIDGDLKVIDHLGEILDSVIIKK